MNLELLLQNQEIEIFDCKRMEYKEALELQLKLQEQRTKDQIKDTILLLEHNHVYTMGKDNVDKNELIKGKLPQGIPLIDVNRGGKITYHGPGQLIGYFIFKLPLHQVHNFITTIEELTIDIVKEYGVKAYSRKEEDDEVYHKKIRGSWCSVNGLHKKISAIGLEFKNVKRNDPEKERTIVSMHGFALNSTTNLTYFNYINPCGFKYNVATSIKEVTPSAIIFLTESSHKTGEVTCL